MRAVITGIAPIASIGIGKQEFFDALFSKKMVLRSTEENYGVDFRSTSKWCVPYPEDVFERFRKYAGKSFGRAPKAAQAAVISARLALKDAGIDIPDEDAAVIIGGSLPNINESMKAAENVFNNRNLHPLTITNIIMNAVPAWVSICLGVHGVSSLTATACASGASAIGTAYEMIRDGKAKTVIAGGSECVTGDHGGVFRSFDCIDALTKSDDGVPMPFGSGRSGFLFSEGACCVLVIEELETALKRGADIYAEITGHYANSDAFHIVAMPEDPVYIRKLFDKVFSENKVDYYSAHGTATPMNDKMEADMLTEAGEKYGSYPAVNSTKGIIGHNLGASGAIEAAVCAYSIKHSVIHGNVTRDPDSRLYLPEDTLKKDIHCAVSASFGFGGHNDMLVFKEYKE